MSNELTSSLIEELVHDDLHHVVLAHLSKENNHPDVAYLEVKYLLDQIKEKRNLDIQLVVAKRDIYSDAIVLD
mgnify:CR=1 FL=1